MDAKLEAGKAAPAGALGTFTRRSPRGRPGRRPAKNPEGQVGADGHIYVQDQEGDQHTLEEPGE